MDTQDLTELGDEQLADAVRGGQAEAYVVLWDRHAAAGRTAARRLTSTFDPDDLVQEAYLRILSALQSGSGPTGPFRPYLYTTLRNVAAGWARSPDPVPVEEVPEVVDPRDLSTEVLERSVTVRAFRKLPDRWQSVLWYTEVEGMEPREAAPLLGLSASATAALAYRAREGLRREWLQAHVNTESVALECRWTVERLGDHARGALSRAAHDRVEEHLTGCLSCSILVEEVDDVASRLRLVLLPLVLGVPAAVGATAPVVTSVAAATATPAPDGAAPPPARSGAREASRGSGPGVVVGAVAAAVVAVALGALALARPWSGTEPAPVVAASERDAVDTTPTPPPLPTPAPDEGAPDQGAPGTPGTDDAPSARPEADGSPEPDRLAGPRDPGPAREAPTGTQPASATQPAEPEITAPAQPEPAVPAPTTPPQPTEPPPVTVTPAPPVVETAPPAGTLTFFPVLRGTGEPGAVVRVQDASGATVATAAVDPDGRWEAVVTELASSGEQVVEVVQEVDGVESAPTTPVGPYVFDLPLVLSPSSGETVAGTLQTVPPQDPLYGVTVAFSGTPGLVVEAFVDGRSTGNLHVLDDAPAVRQVSGLAPGPHTFGLRFVDPASGGSSFGPTVTVDFVVAGP